MPRRGSTEPSRRPCKVRDGKDSDEAFGEGAGARSFVKHRQSGRAKDTGHGGPYTRLNLVEECGKDLQHPKRESLELPCGPTIKASRGVHTPSTNGASQILRRDCREVKGRSPLLEQVLKRPHERLDRNAISVDSKDSVPLLGGMLKCIRRMVGRQAILPGKEVGGGRGCRPGEVLKHSLPSMQGGVTEALLPPAVGGVLPLTSDFLEAALNSLAERSRGARCEILRFQDKSKVAHKPAKPPDGGTRDSRIRHRGDRQTSQAVEELPCKRQETCVKGDGVRRGRAASEADRGGRVPRVRSPCPTWPQSRPTHEVQSQRRGPRPAPSC